MKSLLLICLILLISNGAVYPGWKFKPRFEKQPHPEVKNYPDFLFSLTDRNGINDQKVAKLTTIQLRHALKMLFESRERNAAMADTLIWKYSRKIPGGLKGEITLQLVNGMIQSRIINEIRPSILYHLAWIQYFLSGTIVDIKHSMEKVTERSSSPVTTLTLIVDKIYKGRYDFTPGDTIECYYFDFWRGDNTPFEVGDSYVFPLGLMPDSSLALGRSIDESPGHTGGQFKISDGYFYDSNNAFGYGQRISIGQFEQRLTNDFYLIKSW